jgi:hypothetical protein
MASKPYPAELVTEIESLLDAWNQIDPQMTLGDLTHPVLTGIPCL